MIELSIFGCAVDVSLILLQYFRDECYLLNESGSLCFNIYLSTTIKNSKQPLDF